VQQATATTQITIAWLPFWSPDLNPCEDLWRLIKGVVVANRVDDTVQVLAEHALAWLAALPLADRLQKCGLVSPKLQWLST
jgi:hypothetical protein